MFFQSKYLSQLTFKIFYSLKGRPAAAKLVENGNDHSQIRTEAELLHSFSHKNIVKLYALFHGEMSGLVLELMEGRSLNECEFKFFTYFWLILHF